MSVILSASVRQIRICKHGGNYVRLGAEVLTEKICGGCKTRDFDRENAVFC